MNLNLNGADSDSVRIEYEGGRTALFDTLSFTEGSPFSGANMLTEFELEMREEPEKGLWLTANWHQVRDDWRADAPADGIPAARRSRGWRFMLASEAELGQARRVLLDGDEAFARVRGFLCDAAAITACYREHVGPPSKPLKSQIRDLQRALGRAEVPGVPDELARLLAEEKEEGAEEGARKVKEDWGDVDEETWQVPHGGAEGHAGLFRLAVPRRVQVGDVGGGNENSAEATSESRKRTRSHARAWDLVR